MDFGGIQTLPVTPSNPGRAWRGPVQFPHFTGGQTEAQASPMPVRCVHAAPLVFRACHRYNHSISIFCSIYGPSLLPFPFTNLRVSRSQMPFHACPPPPLFCGVDFFSSFLEAQFAHHLLRGVFRDFPPILETARRRKGTWTWAGRHSGLNAMARPGRPLPSPSFFGFLHWR